MKDSVEPQKNPPRCFAALDFEILCRLKGKAFAIRISLKTIARQKEEELEDTYYKNRPRPLKKPPTRPLIPMGGH